MRPQNRYILLRYDCTRSEPTDLQTLNLWISEGLVMPTQMVRDAETGDVTNASALDGLIFPTRQLYEGEVPPPYAAYPRIDIIPNLTPPGSRSIRTSWTCVIVGALCFPPAAIAAPIYSCRAWKEGHPRAALVIAIQCVLAIAIAAIWLSQVVATLTGHPPVHGPHSR